MSLETKAVALEFKWTPDAETSGSFSGVAAHFGNIDFVGDVIEAGAFTASLGEHKANGTRPVLLWAHNPDEPIGVVDTLDQTSRGLEIKGRFAVDTVRGGDAYRLARMGAVTGLSIGYRATRATRDAKGIRKILAADLAEISLVAMPANDRARLTSVKAAGAAEGENMTDFIEDGAAAGSADIEAKLAEIEAKAAKVDELETKLADAVKRADDFELRISRPGVISAKDSRGEIERKAFLGFVRQGRESLGPDEVKSLRVADDTAGGYLAPAQFLAELDRNLTLLSPMRSVARVAQTSSGSIIIPRRTSEMTCDWVGEMESRSETAPVYGSVEIFVHEVAAYIDVSVKLLEDAAINIEAELARDFAEDFALREGAAFITGSGVKRPEGIMTAAGVDSVNSGAATSITADGLIGLYYALKAPYRGSAVWMMNAATLSAVRKLKDGEGQYLWAPGLQPGQPESLLGRPVVEAPDMPNVGAGTYPIALGDWSTAYRIVDKPAVSLLRDPFTQATSGLVRFHGRKRVGGAVVRPEAMKKLYISA